MISTTSSTRKGDSKAIKDTSAAMGHNGVKSNSLIGKTINNEVLSNKQVG